MGNTGERFIRRYFDAVYNPIYDFTTARSSRYLELQTRCVEQLSPAAGERVLCVGLGTGNEIIRLLERNPELELVGIDYSPRALARARHKAVRLGASVELHQMDVRRLDFPDASFDRALCIHVADFLTEPESMMREIHRVLRPGGCCVVTYPSDTEGVKLGFGILRHQVRRVDGLARARALCRYAVSMLLGVLYLPLMLRPGKRVYSRRSLEEMLRRYGDPGQHIDEDPIYHDFIVCGTKANHKEA